MEDTYKTIINELRGIPFEACRFQEVYDFLLELFNIPRPSALKKRGRYISIDGIGGSGKDTLIGYLSQRGLVPFKEDDYDPFHAMVRRYWEGISTEEYNPVIPAYLIACGKIYVNCSNLSQLLFVKNVVSNRSFISAIALNMAEKVSLKEMINVYKLFPIIADQRILLTCEPEIAYKRKIKANAVGRSDSIEFLRKSYTLFLELEKHFPLSVIDTTNITSGEVALQVNQIIL